MKPEVLCEGDTAHLPLQLACFFTVLTVQLMPGQATLQACCCAHKPAQRPRHVSQLSMLPSLPLKGTNARPCVLQGQQPGP